MTGMIAGTISVKITSAVLKRNTEMFGKMSPFVEVELGSQKRRTTTQKKAGKNPNFGGEVLEFETDAPTLKLTVWDEESIKKNDLVGEATFHYDKVTRGELK